MSTTERRVYAIRYARRDGTRSGAFHGGDPHDGPLAMDYFIWLIAGDGAPIVVDTGFIPEVGQRRGRQTVSDPVEVMGRLGVNANDVENVILTHFHYDHCGGVAAFPNAQFWVQDAEMGFWTGRYATRGAFRHSIEAEDIIGLVRLNFDGRIRFVEGDATLANGISVHHVGGHTAGLQIVRVLLPEGPMILASDASHYYANLEEDRPFTTLTSLPEMYGAFERVRELADGSQAIIPGHDPLVMERYGAVAPEFTGLAVELTA